MNLRARQIRLHEHTFPVQEVTGLVAVRATDRPRKGTVHVEINKDSVAVPVLELKSITDLIPGVEPTELARFESTGWYFVDSRKLPGTPDRVLARVLLDPEGHVTLAPNRVTVKVANAKADPAQLFPVGVLQVTPLKFADGLYSILFDPKGERDALEIADELQASGKVVYAEPELLAFISGRG